MGHNGRRPLSMLVHNNTMLMHNNAPSRTAMARGIRRLPAQLAGTRIAPWATIKPSEGRTLSTVNP